MNSSDASTLAGYVATWHAREPEMRLAEVFAPAAARARYRVWGALFFVLREAAFELSDSRVTAVKAGWWAEELLALAQGRPRHPLTCALAGVEAPWPALARALPEAALDERRPADSQAGLSMLAPLAQALAAVEAALFSTANVPATHGSDTHLTAASRAIAVHLLAERLRFGPGAADAARLPMDLLARHGVGLNVLAADPLHPALADWAGELLARLPADLGAAPLFRRQRAAFDRVRLLRRSARLPEAAPAGLPTLWRAWRAAR